MDKPTIKIEINTKGVNIIILAISMFKIFLQKYGFFMNYKKNVILHRHGAKGVIPENFDGNPLIR
jgi:hypothetical protein